MVCNKRQAQIITEFSWCLCETCYQGQEAQLNASKIVSNKDKSIQKPKLCALCDSALKQNEIIWTFLNNHRMLQCHKSCWKIIHYRDPKNCKFCFYPNITCPFGSTDPATRNSDNDNMNTLLSKIYQDDDGKLFVLYRMSIELPENFLLSEKQKLITSEIQNVSTNSTGYSKINDNMFNSIFANGDGTLYTVFRLDVSSNTLSNQQINPIIAVNTIKLNIFMKLENDDPYIPPEIKVIFNHVPAILFL